MMKFLGLLKINDNNHYFIVHQVITKGLNTRYVGTSGVLIAQRQSLIGNYGIKNL